MRDLTSTRLNLQPDAEPLCHDRGTEIAHTLYY